MIMSEEDLKEIVKKVELSKGGVFGPLSGFVGGYVS